MALKGVRVFLTGFLSYLVGPNVSDSFTHYSDGWVIFVAAFLFAPQPQGRVRVAASVDKFGRSTKSDWLMYSLVQAATATPVARGSESCAISGSRSATSGLTVGEH
jgi:hypothetical protein